MKRRTALFALLCWCFFVGCGRNGAGGAITLRASLILSETSDWYAGTERWAELVKRESEGRIAVRIFPQAALASGKQDTELEMLQTGGIDVSFQSSILLSGIDPAFSVWSLPFLLPSYEAADVLLDGPQGQVLLDRLPGKGLVGLGYGHNGFRQVTNSKRPVRTPEDLRGLKVRVPAISMYLDIFRAYGADPTPMNFGEVFVALQQGTIDGQENPLSVIKSARLAEVQRYLTTWNYSYDPIVLCINKGVWDRLAPEDQALLKRTARRALGYQRRLVEENERRILDELRAEGMEVIQPTPEQVRAFREAVRHIGDAYADRIGPELIRQFRLGAEDERFMPSGGDPALEGARSLMPDAARLTE